MGAEDLSRLVSKVCGPILIVMSPLFILLLLLDPLAKVPRPLSPKELFGIVLIGALGFLIGAYMCHREYNWFGWMFRKK